MGGSSRCRLSPPDGRRSGRCRRRLSRRFISFGNVGARHDFPVIPNRPRTYSRSQASYPISMLTEPMAFQFLETGPLVDAELELVTPDVQWVDQLLQACAHPRSASDPTAPTMTRS